MQISEAHIDDNLAFRSLGEVDAVHDVTDDLLNVPPLEVHLAHGGVILLNRPLEALLDAVVILEQVLHVIVGVAAAVVVLAHIKHGDAAI